MLSQFDTQADEFSPQRVRDELIGQMSELLGVDYDVLALDLTESEAVTVHWSATRRRPRHSRPCPIPPGAGRPPVMRQRPRRPWPAWDGQAPSPTPDNAAGEASRATQSGGASGDLLQAHRLAGTDDGSDPIHPAHGRRPVGDALPPDFSANVLQSIPVQAGGLYPISDVWYIDPGLDTPDRLRIHIAQFAREIAAKRTWTGASMTVPTASVSHAVARPHHRRAAPCWRCWRAGPEPAESVWTTGNSPLICRHCCTARVISHDATERHRSGQALFRLLRLARRLLDLEASTTDPGT